MRAATELVLRGELAADDLTDWVCHRARLLDLAGWLTRPGPTEARIVVTGPGPLIDAMEVACLLGPSDVWVETVDTRQIPLDEAPNGFALRES